MITLHFTGSGAEFASSFPANNNCPHANSEPQRFLATFWRQKVALRRTAINLFVEIITVPVD